MICPVTDRYCRTNGCGEKCYKRDMLGHEPIKPKTMAQENVSGGCNFLHNHTHMEKELGVPSGHVIVDRSDWEFAISFFQQNKKLLINKNQKKSNFEDGHGSKQFMH